NHPATRAITAPAIPCHAPHCAFPCLRRPDREYRDQSPGSPTTLVVCKGVRFSLRAFDAGEDLVSVFGPGEGPGMVVPVVDERADGGGQLLDGGEGAAADGLAGDDREEAFH